MLSFVAECGREVRLQLALHNLLGTVLLALRLKSERVASLDLGWASALPPFVGAELAYRSFESNPGLDALGVCTAAPKLLDAW